MDREYVSRLVEQVRYMGKTPEVQSIQSDRDVDELVNEING